MKWIIVNLKIVNNVKMKISWTIEYSGHKRNIPYSIKQLQDQHFQGVNPSINLTFEEVVFLLISRISLTISTNQ